uniref:Programmed cell death protein 2 n=1 Tax=Lygus hesperus TaxID=30085 RepID=A0A0A9WW25_LYGHE
MVVRTTEKPLFMNPPHVAQTTRISPCTYCGMARIHELQIMPTALYYLHVADYLPVAQTGGTIRSANMDGVDFGTVTVYSCAHECARHAKGVFVHQEFVCVEDAPPMQLPTNTDNCSK